MRELPQAVERRCGSTEPRTDVLWAANLPQAGFCGGTNVPEPQPDVLCVLGFLGLAQTEMGAQQSWF